MEEEVLKIGFGKQNCELWVFLDGDGSEFLVSYGIPIAGWSPELGGWFAIEEAPDAYTSRHLNNYTKDRPVEFELVSGDIIGAVFAHRTNGPETQYENRVGKDGHGSASNDGGWQASPTSPPQIVGVPWGGLSQP